MKVTQLMPTPTGYVASGTFQCVLPIGLSYEELYMVGTGTFTLADFTSITVQANGKPIQEFRSGGELDAINQYNKRTAAGTNKILVVDFTRRLLCDRAYREFTKVGTGMPIDLNKTLGTTANGQAIPNPNYNPFPIQTFIIQGTLGSGLAAAATLKIFAKQSDPAPTGLIRKIRKFQHNPTTTPFEIPDYPKGDLINAIYLWTTIFNPTSSVGVKMTNVKLLRDNYTVFDRTTTLNNLIETDEIIRTPQSGLQVLDTTESGYGDQVITTSGVNDLRLRIDFSTTPTQLVSTVDYIGQLDR